MKGERGRVISNFDSIERIPGDQGPKGFPGREGGMGWPGYVYVFVLGYLFT